MLRRADFENVSRTWAKQFAEGLGVDIEAEKGGKKYLFQLKYGNKPKLFDAWQEAENAIVNSKKEVAVGVCRFKKTRNTLVVLGLHQFLQLLQN